MDIRTGIQRTAQALGINPLDLATAISYETGGTFSPTQAGPTTQWGQHRGLIQFGEPQAKRYGVDWNDPLGSQLGENGAVANYLRDTGVQPGMGLLDIYSAINAGGVGRYNASDANNGGAPGTVRDKVERQMSGHRRKAAELLNMPEAVASDTMRALGAAPQTQEQPMGLLSMSTQGQAPQQEKERWWTPDRRDRLVLGLEGMTLNPNRGLMLAASQGIQGRREDRKEQETQRKAEERRTRTAEWLASRGLDDLARAVAGGMIDAKAAVGAALRPGPATYRQITGEDAAAMGLDPARAYNINEATGQVTGIGAGDTNINMPGNAQISGDYVIMPDPNSETGVRMTPIPGSKADLAQKSNVAETASERAQSAERDRVQRLKMGTTINNLNLNIAEIEDGGMPVTGTIGALGGLIPGTPQRDFAVRQEQINTRAALDEIQTMRDNSPTGGAVGQLTDGERQAIATAATSLNQSSSAEEYLRSAKRFRQTMLDIAFGEGNWTVNNGEIEVKVSSGEGGLPAGVSQSEWDAMTPEERALWQN